MWQMQSTCPPDSEVMKKRHSSRSYTCMADQLLVLKELRVNTSQVSDQCADPMGRLYRAFSKIAKSSSPVTGWYCHSSTGSRMLTSSLVLVLPLRKAVTGASKYSTQLKKTQMATKTRLMSCVGVAAYLEPIQRQLQPSYACLLALSCLWCGRSR